MDLNLKEEVDAKAVKEVKTEKLHEQATEAAPAEGAAPADLEATAKTGAAAMYASPSKTIADVNKSMSTVRKASAPSVDAEMTDVTAKAEEPAAEEVSPSKGAAQEATAAEESEIKIEPITIGFRTFASGNECYDYFRSLLTQLSHEQDLNEYEFVMVMDLLRKGHADPLGKIGPGVKAVQVKPHEELDSVCFFVHRIDGSKEDFSYRKCIMRLFKDLKDPQYKNDLIGNTRGRGGRNSSGRGRGRARGRGGGGRGRGRGRGRK